MQTPPQKFAPTLVLKWYPQDLVGRVKLFDISAAKQNQGARQMHFQPTHFPFGTQRRVLYRGQFVIWLGVLIIMFNLIILQCINLFKVERKRQSISETSTF